MLKDLVKTTSSSSVTPKVQCVCTVCLYSVSVQRVYMCTSVTCGLMCTARTLSVR